MTEGKSVKSLYAIILMYSFKMKGWSSNNMQRGKFEYPQRNYVAIFQLSQVSPIHYLDCTEIAKNNYWAGSQNELYHNDYEKNYRL